MQTQALANQNLLPTMSDTPFDELPFDEAPAQLPLPLQINLLDLLSYSWYHNLFHSNK
jgi:hypothetical protein